MHSSMCHVSPTEHSEFLSFAFMCFLYRKLHFSYFFPPSSLNKFFSSLFMWFAMKKLTAVNPPRESHLYLTTGLFAVSLKKNMIFQNKKYFHSWGKKMTVLVDTTQASLPLTFLQTSHQLQEIPSSFKIKMKLGYLWFLKNYHTAILKVI